MKTATQILISLIGLTLFTPGCALLRTYGIIKSPSVTVVGVKDAGKPATLASDVKVDTMTIPAGTTVTTTKVESVASTPATSTTSAIPFQPAKEITTFTVPKEVKWDKTTTSISANTGTVDTSIAEHKIDVAASQPLLYAAIVSALAAGFFIYRAYPTPAFICGASSVAFLMAWKMTGMPDWMWAIGAAGLAAAVFLYLGHERGLATIQLPISVPATPAAVTLIPPATSINPSVK